MGGGESKTIIKYVEKDTSHLDKKIEQQNQQIQRLMKELKSMSSNLYHAVNNHQQQMQQQRKDQERALQIERKNFEQMLKKQTKLNNREREKERRKFDKKMKEKEIQEAKQRAMQIRVHNVNMKLLYEGQIQSLDEFMLDVDKQVTESKHLCDELEKEINLEEQQIKKFKTERNDPSCKVLKMIGLTGAGKSTFCNRFLGDRSQRGNKGVIGSKFKVGDGIKSETQTISKSIRKINDTKYVVIDTPGSADSQGRDKHFMNLIISYLRGCGGINAFLVFFSLVNARLDYNYKKLLDEYQDRMGGRSFWKNAIFVFTKYDLVLHDYNGDTKQAKRKAKNIIREVRDHFNLSNTNNDPDDSDYEEDFEEIKIPYVCIGKDNYTEAINKLINLIPKDKFRSKELKSPYDDMKNKYKILFDNYERLSTKLNSLQVRKVDLRGKLNVVNKKLNQNN